MVIQLNKHQKKANQANLESIKPQQGFTLIEIMIVCVVMAVMASIAIPSYQHYIIVTKRADMMVELQNRGSTLESLKLKKGTYKSLTDDDLSDLNTPFPVGNALYNVNITSLNASGTNVTAPPHSSQWTITATPIATGQMKEDGTLSLNYQGIKCRVISISDKKCGTDNQWKQ